MGIFNEFHRKEKPVFTGIARGVGGFAFGKAAAAGGGGAEAVIYTQNSGGIIQTYDAPGGDVYKVHIFTTPGNLVWGDPSVTSIEYTVIGGGGGGGFQHGGGGGAGGLSSTDPTVPAPRRSSPVPITPGSYSVTVGYGGNGHSAYNPAEYPRIRKAAQGDGSSLAYNGGTISVGGGGQGGNYAADPNRYGNSVTNGSAGGGGSTEGDAASPTATAPNSTFGSPGGYGRYAGGGGGGFLTPGGNVAPVSPYNTNPAAANGGGGVGIRMTGPPTERQVVGSLWDPTNSPDPEGGYFAGGGGGGTHGAGQPYRGPAVNGGGAGGFSTPTNARTDPQWNPPAGGNYMGNHAEMHTGGGGGGSGAAGVSGGKGGNGVVIVRYTIPSSDSTERTVASATGGAISVFNCPGDSILGAGQKVIHVFVGSGTFTVPASFNKTVEYVAIGGGGGGGMSGGGGGAGAFVHGTTPISGPGSFAIRVGEGGMGRGNQSQEENGQSGQPTTIAFPSSVTALGGGGGASGSNAAGVAYPGGSGGGGGESATTGGTGADTYPGNSNDVSPANGWGYDGADYASGGPTFAGAGGGGAGGSGTGGDTTNAGVGGPGIRLPSTFHSPLMAPVGNNGGGLGVMNPGAPAPTQLYWVCGGGPGGYEGTGTAKPGGVGGGGYQYGTNINSHPDSHGRTSTGSGGAASNVYNGTNSGGSGACGIVLIAYPV